MPYPTGRPQPTSYHHAGLPVWRLAGLPVWRLAGLLMWLLAGLWSGSPACPADQPQVAPPRDDPISSPLHDFLGIDPNTGRFRPIDSTTTPAAPSGVDRASSSDGLADDLSDPAVRASEAFRRATEQIRDGSLPDLTELLNESAGSQAIFRLHRQAIGIGAALLMIYPIGIILGETFAFMLDRSRNDWTEVDRRYQRTRLIRKLIQGICLAALIAILAIGAANGYFWNRPTWFSFFAAAVVGLGSVTVMLTSLMRRSARTHELDLIRSVVRHQLELRADLEELRRKIERVEPQ